MPVQGERGFAIGKPAQGHPDQARPPAFPEPGAGPAREEVDNVSAGSEQGGVHILVTAQLGNPGGGKGYRGPQFLAHLLVLGDVQCARRKCPTHLDGSHDLLLGSGPEVANVDAPGLAQR